ncbi:carboxylating nicotinate-nucleotide diphosphorylase [Nitrospirillum viridazoti]|uniref:Probable nicotinate-nucleotide pyrophosphorylase [carboxylating] n=1 Tax=Nitrospirillum viridazoti CBAmc TaxID=1441467 RepID=A0A248JLF4_9PROT|nr:carboxylating nicotinate-nucleotide diphosphorylase [Nitrospirillum amazonense]ASG19573.1 nicotinate-nucleotide diphosphorylase (carboxylating) [Nitrospirillum amazonense CBAmc]TWB26603.1 nicotinate-nucleotide pyrophosphorylase [carboxylating] [Nitrospirillum amazonense]
MSTPVAPLYPVMYEGLVRAALLEDLGRAGDVTADACIPVDTQARALFQARHAGVIAGLAPALSAFSLLDPSLSVRTLVADGAAVAPGQAVAVVEGAARPILSGERTALNLLGRLCGIASKTAELVRAIEGTGAHIVCTRKTTPGLRALEKYAVRVGGGSNHRFGLDDAVLIKDNHLVAAGGLRAAVERARAHVGHMVKIEVEVDTLAQLEELLTLPVDAVLLDNMTPATLRQAVDMVAGRLITEASGGITPETVRAVAETGVTLISLGWLTHSVTNFDIGLDFESL